jgi:hypothetical protein
MAGTEAGVNYFLGFLLRKNPKFNTGKDAVFEQRKG